MLGLLSIVVLFTSLISPSHAVGNKPICIKETLDKARLQPNYLPVILLHGYKESPSVWHSWEKILDDRNIPYCTVAFSQTSQDFDQCGSSSAHANQLGSIVAQVMNKTGKNQVNIVAHSKGGLDARVYLDKSHTTNVANLIMIGTPNGGAPVEDEFILVEQCNPGGEDILTGSDTTQAKENTHTNYYTIAGDWTPPPPFVIPSYAWFNPHLIWFDTFFPIASIQANCPQQDLLDFEARGFSFLMAKGFGNNDGLVPETSANALPYAKNIGTTNDCHSNLLNKDSFDYAETYLRTS
jgi:pimeloyl-ACP methyl ester carboxylesterase